MEIAIGIFVVWAVVALIFYVKIRKEVEDRDIEYAPLQAVVALLWFVWVFWYIYSLVDEQLIKARVA